jgi:hypothetical protein
MEEYKKEIADFVYYSHEYPTMQEMMDKFVISHPARLGMWIRAVTELEDTILYDDKHNTWIYIKPSEKMKEWMKDAKPI